MVAVDSDRRVSSSERIRAIASIMLSSTTRRAVAASLLLLVDVDGAFGSNAAGIAAAKVAAELCSFADDDALNGPFGPCWSSADACDAGCQISMLLYSRWRAEGEAAAAVGMLWWWYTVDKHKHCVVWVFWPWRLVGFGCRFGVGVCFCVFLSLTNGHLIKDDHIKHNLNKHIRHILHYTYIE